MDDATYESRRLSQKDPGLDPTRHMIKKLRIRHITYELRMGPLVKRSTHMGLVLS